MIFFKKSTVTVSIFFLFFISAGIFPEVSSAGVPHIVYGNVTDSEGIPSNGSVSFKAYVSERPNEILTESDTGCGYKDGLWWVEVGNFSNTWSVSETLIITTDKNTSNIILNGNGTQELSLSVTAGTGTEDKSEDSGGDGDTNSCFISTVYYERDDLNNNLVWILLFIFLFMGVIAGKGKKTLFSYRISSHLKKLTLGIIFFQLFFITGFDGKPSFAVAESVTFELKAGLNGISIPFQDTEIITAEDMINAISGCDLVKYWDPNQQKYVEYHKGSGTDNFTAEPGKPYFVRVTSATSWTLSGEIMADTEFQPVTTQTTNINAFAVPLNRTDLTDAEALANEISNCDAVWYWDPGKGGYVGHPKGTLINNFPVRVGYSYMINARKADAHEGTDNDGDGYTKEQGDCNDADPGIHPGATEICGDETDQDCDGRDNMFTAEPDNLLHFKIDTVERNAPFTEVSPPLIFDIISVKKGGTEIEMPDNIIFDEATGSFSWTPTESQTGGYEFLFSVSNAQTEINKTAYITVTEPSHKDIPDVSASPVFINPSMGEKCTIRYRLEADSNVTVELYRTYVAIGSQGEGHFQREFKMKLVNNQPRSAGLNTEIWDGRDLYGNLIKDDDGNLLESAYLYVIKADRKNGKTDIYDPVYVSGLATISDCATAPPNFNPYANQPLEIRYNLLAPAWVTIGGRGMRGFVIEGSPRDQGENMEFWNGINQLGELMTGSLNLEAKAEILPENVIVVTGIQDSVIKDVTTESFVIIPAYGEISTVKYVLTRDAVISVAISDPNGNIWTLSEAQSQDEGEHSVEWHGTNSEGKIVWPLTEVGLQSGETVEMPEGDYTVTITAFDSAHTQLDKKTANIHVYR